MPSNTQASTAPPLDLRWTFSNALSAVRILLAFPVWYTLEQNMRWTTIAIALAAMVTDILDGYFARKFNEVSDLGKILDPLADKVFLAVAAVVMLATGMLPIWFVAVVLGRDLLIFLGGIVIEKRTGIVLPSNYVGKAAVVSLSATLIFLMGGMNQNVVDFFYGLTLVLLATSLVIYTRRAIKVWNGEAA